MTRSCSCQRVDIGRGSIRRGGDRCRKMGMGMVGDVGTHIGVGGGGTRVGSTWGEIEQHAGVVPSLGPIRMHLAPGFSAHGAALRSFVLI